IVADKEAKVKKALVAALERINRFSEGVIREVRRANPDGTTSYMRPMPGGARMYPETDTLPIIPDLSSVTLGKTISEYAEKLLKDGVKDMDIAKQIASEYRQVYEELLVQTGSDPQTLATQIISGSSVLEPSVAVYSDIFVAMNTGKIPKNAFLDVLELIKKGKTVRAAISAKESLSKEETEKIVETILSELGDIDMSKMGLIMGKVMAASHGKADGKLVSEILKAKFK
ncbi:MAG: GatB/YqeY domain-containing protein, partial [bacterium]